MRMLVTVAVFGLVPMPPMPDTVNYRFDDPPITRKIFEVTRLVIVPGPLIERMATSEELTRMRSELEGIAATQGDDAGASGSP